MENTKVWSRSKRGIRSLKCMNPKRVVHIRCLGFIVNPKQKYMYPPDREFGVCDVYTKRKHRDL